MAVVKVTVFWFGIDMEGIKDKGKEDDSTKMKKNQREDCKMFKRTTAVV